MTEREIEDIVWHGKEPENQESVFITVEQMQDEALYSFEGECNWMQGKDWKEDLSDTEHYKNVNEWQMAS